MPQVIFPSIRDNILILFYAAQGTVGSYGAIAIKRYIANEKSCLGYALTLPLDVTLLLRFEGKSLNLVGPHRGDRLYLLVIAGFALDVQAIALLKHFL